MSLQDNNTISNYTYKKNTHLNLIQYYENKAIIYYLFIIPSVIYCS